MNVWLVLTLLVSHWIGDFLLQNNWMAMNKSKMFKPLVVHTIVYSLFMMLSLYVICNVFFNINNIDDIFLFGVSMFITHTLIDFVTSKITTYFYNKKQYRMFFDTIGLDQLLHYFTIFLTFKYIFY